MPNPTKSGVLQSLSTTPMGCMVDGISFTPLTSVQYELAKSCYFADPPKPCTVEYTAGPPITVVNVGSP